MGPSDAERATIEHCGNGSIRTEADREVREHGRPGGVGGELNRYPANDRFAQELDCLTEYRPDSSSRQLDLPVGYSMPTPYGARICRRQCR